MKVLNYREFKNHLAENLEAVNDDREILVVSLKNKKTVVVLDLDDYNSIQETLNINNTLANRRRLDEALAEMNRGEFITKDLIVE